MDISNLPLKAHLSEPSGSDQNKYYLAQFREHVNATSLMRLLASLVTYHFHHFSVFPILDGEKIKKLSAFQIDRSFGYGYLVNIITIMLTKYPISLCTVNRGKLRSLRRRKELK